jgi:dihydroneopterin aldolase
MTSDIALAFGQLEERAAALASGDPYDRISLRDYVLEVEIGAFQQERGHLQQVRFNIVVEVEPVAQPLEDDVDRILSYDRLTEAIGYELAAERLNLLETLADRIATRILAEPQAYRVFVRIEKIDRGPFDLGVEIVRTRVDAFAGDTLQSEAPQPRVAFLSDTVFQNARLSDWIDELAQDAPLILTVGACDSVTPQSQNAMAQRRIDLLAIEQNAWVLAARDRRCIVVETLTELDWAMKNGQICVWAPTKIVLDAVDGPKVNPRETQALAVWFAEFIGAFEFIAIAGVPTRQLEMT